MSPELRHTFQESVQTLASAALRQAPQQGVLAVPRPIRHVAALNELEAVATGEGAIGHVAEL